MWKPKGDFAYMSVMDLVITWYLQNVLFCEFKNSLVFKWVLFKRKCNNLLEKNSKNIYTIRSGEKGEPALERYHGLFYSPWGLSFFEEKGLKYKQNISDLSR